jgi:hypothetical protein
VGLLDNLGFTSFLDTGLGTELSNLGLLTGIVGEVNSVLSGAFGTLGPVVESTLNGILQTLGLSTSSVLSAANLETALNGTSIADLLGTTTLNDSLANILTALGVGGATPSDLTLADLLQGLGFPDTIGGLTLTDLVNDLSVGGSGIGDLLNGVNLGDLLGDLGLSDLPLNLSNLGDLGDLTVGGLLGDLGLGDLATINIYGFGGLGTLLADVIPQQILAAL